MTPDLDAIRADLDRRVPARDLADRDHCRALLDEVERLRDAIRADFRIYERTLRAAAEPLGLDMDDDQCIPGCNETGSAAHLIWHIADQRDRLAATLDRVQEALDRLVLPHQVTGEPTGRHAQAAADYIRAAIEGTDS